MEPVAVLTATDLAREVLKGSRRIQEEILDRLDDLLAAGDAASAERLAALDLTCTHVALAADAALRLLEHGAAERSDSALMAADEAWSAARQTFETAESGAPVNAAFDRLYDRLEVLSDGEIPDAAEDRFHIKSLDFGEELFTGSGSGGGDAMSPGAGGGDWEQAAAEPPRMAPAHRPAALIQRIFLGTDRAPDPKAAGGFGHGRNPALVLAEVRVSVPTARKAGDLPRPGRFLLWPEREDPSRHIMIAGGPEVLDEAAFLDRLKAEADGEAGFLFVHGYNTPFANGLYRTAQLAVDLEVAGPVFHYSWPSAGNPVLYDYDDASAVRARTFLRRFLELIVDKAGVTRLNIIAHSKGNDLMLQTLQLIAAGRETLTDGELVMASPDVDATVAEQIIPALVGLFHGMTLYANDHDRPLRISRVKAGGVPRAGGLLPDGAPLIVDGADSIDAGDSDFAWFGLNHDAYVMAPALRYDIKALFERHTRPVHHRTPTFLLRDQPRTPFWRPAET